MKLREPIPHYPGKPGPKPTGLKRSKQFPFMLSADEELYLKLAAYDANRLKTSPYIRSRVLPSDWRLRLEKLKKKYPKL